MNVRFLGTGTSTGVPHIGCECVVCKSSDIKDRRLRSSVLITENSHHVLIDCGPDFRQQALQTQLNSLDGVLLTHEHYDHMWGLDDLRVMGDTHIYAEDRVLRTLRANMPYCFGENKYPGSPTLHLHSVQPYQAFQIGGMKIIPLRVMHAKLPILGYRINDCAYITDMKSANDDLYEYLQGLDVLILNALRHSPHPSHIHVDEACEIAMRVGARRTYFTHCSHDIGLYKDMEKKLPSGVYLAYDGLELTL